MLMKTNDDAHVIPQGGMGPQVQPIQLLKTHSLAHQNLGPRELGILGAGWVDHRVLVLPTVETAHDVFGVSEQLIARERKQRPPASLPLGLLVLGLLTATEAELVAVFTENETKIWRTLERVQDLQC
jgi:hypothetical protein